MSVRATNEASSINLAGCSATFQSRGRIVGTSDASCSDERPPGWTVPLAFSSSDTYRKFDTLDLQIDFIE